MTPKEFKAWFDGFTEAMDDKPTAKQWARVKERVAEIDGKAVTEKVYVDRYLPTYPHYYERYRRWYDAEPMRITCSATSTNTALGSVAAAGNLTARANTAANFDSLRAMAQLGQADAAALRA